MNLQTIIQEAASIANVISVVVLGIGYYFLIKLYREWVHQRQEVHTAGGRPQVVVVAEYSHPPEVYLVVRNFREISCLWDSLPSLMPLLKEKGLEDGIGVATLSTRTSLVSLTRPSGYSTRCASKAPGSHPPRA